MIASYESQHKSNCHLAITLECSKFALYLQYSIGLIFSLLEEKSIYGCYNTKTPGRNLDGSL